MSQLLVLFTSEKPYENSLLIRFAGVLEECHLSYTRMDQDCLTVGKENSPFVLSAVTPKVRVSAPQLLLVCDEGCTALPHLEDCENVTVILSSQSHMEAAGLPFDRCRFLTYGFSSRDTVTISSITEEVAVISIQRRFQTLHGRYVEPMELLIPTQGVDKSVLLPVVTAMVYCEIDANCWNLPVL